MRNKARTEIYDLLIAQATAAPFEMLGYRAWRQRVRECGGATEAALALLPAPTSEWQEDSLLMPSSQPMASAGGLVRRLVTVRPDCYADEELLRRWAARMIEHAVQKRNRENV